MRRAILARLAIPAFAVGLAGAMTAAAGPAPPDVTFPLDYARNSIATVVADGPNGRQLGTAFLARSFENGQLALTANHVVAGAVRVSLEFANYFLSIPATVVRRDTVDDIAVLRISRYVAHALPLGDVSEIFGGERVYVLSFPRPVELGVGDATATEGIVGVIRAREQRIQIQTPISHGSSGAPLLNLRGQVIGVVVSELHAEAQGINFASWINPAKPLLDAAAESSSASSNAMALTRAAGLGDLARVIALLEEGRMSVNTRDELGQTPLVEAAAGSGTLRMVGFLLDRGAGVDVADASSGQTALVAAARRPGSLEIVRLLVSRGAAVNARDLIGRTALTYAAARGDVPTVRFLIGRGATVDVPDKQYGYTPLLAATRSNLPDELRRQIVAVLVGSGAAVNVRDHTGGTPLMHAAAWGDAETVRLLVDRGAAVNARDKLAHDAVWHAAQSLVAYPEWSAAPSGLPSHRQILMDAAAHGERGKVHGLVAAGASVCRQTGRGGSADADRAWQRYRSALDVLERAGAAFWASTPKRWTPLLVAAWDGDVVKVRALLDRGADVWARDGEGWTALTAAAWRGGRDGLEMVKLLRAHGADPEPQDEFGRTPSMYAAAHGDAEIVKTLRAGRWIPLLDSEGHDAGWYAHQCGRTSVERVLGTVR